MKRWGAVAVAGALSSCATTHEGAPVVLEGYLSLNDSLRLYDNPADARTRNGGDCVQIVRRQDQQSRSIPDGPVRVRGRLMQLDGEIMNIQIGTDFASQHACNGRYMARAEIEALIQD